MSEPHKPDLARRLSRMGNRVTKLENKLRNALEALRMAPSCLNDDCGSVTGVCLRHGEMDAEYHSEDCEKYQKLRSELLGSSQNYETPPP